MPATAEETFGADDAAELQPHVEVLGAGQPEGDSRRGGEHRVTDGLMPIVPDPVTEQAHRETEPGGPDPRIDIDRHVRPVGVGLPRDRVASDDELRPLPDPTKLEPRT